MIKYQDQSLEGLLNILAILIKIMMVILLRMKPQKVVHKAAPHLMRSCPAFEQKIELGLFLQTC